MPPRLLLALSLLIAPLATTHAQTTEPDLPARLLNQPLYLRGMWQQDNLKFAADGTPISPKAQLPFTLCGVDIRALEVKDNKLILTGNRMWLEFNPQLKRVDPKEKIRIEIAVPPSGDFAPALDSIFANGLADLTPSLPHPWQAYAYRTFLQQPPPVGVRPMTVPSRQPRRPPVDPDAPHTVQPRVIDTAEPETPEAVRKMQYNAALMVNFVVGTDGEAHDVQVLRPAGLGMDEQALLAVSRYRFKPATTDGVPVNVEINVEVNVQNYFGTGLLSPGIGIPSGRQP